MKGKLAFFAKLKCRGPASHFTCLQYSDRAFKISDDDDETYRQLST